MSNFWVTLRIVLNILAVITLGVFILLILNINNYIESPYWMLGAGLIWLMFLITILLFIIAASLRWLPTPKKFENKSMRESLKQNK